VIEYHVIAICESNTVLARVASLAHTEANVPDDGVVGVRERDTIAVYLAGHDSVSSPVVRL